MEVRDSPNGFALEIKSLKKTFADITALDDITVNIEKGKIIGLLGQNGAGKSTLVRLLSGVMRPTSGTAKIFGYDLHENKNDVKRITGLLPEEYALYEKLSVYEYVQFIATLYDIPENIFEKRFADLTRRMEMKTLQYRMIETLSKGQKQKVAFITSIIHEPDVLFLDEPLANLDIHAQQVVREIIKEYQRTDRIILIATHLLVNVASTCDDLLVIDNGKISYSGALSTFQGEYASLEEAYIHIIPRGETR